MRYLAILFFLIQLSPLARAQKFTISGYVRDSETGESLIGANIVRSQTIAGTTTNTHGFYSITFKKDTVSLIASYVGYQPIIAFFCLDRDTTFNFNLSTAVLKELVVSASRTDAIHESSQMSMQTIPIEQVKALPALLGEIDILKTLQLLPGVQSGNEGSTGLYVRGGGPDQNLILLDGVPIYNVSHLFGFFSIFNADAINHVELTKGGFPARYGGRLSSVIDISMKEGNKKKVKGEGSIGLISAKAMVEGPIVKGKTSFIVSARRTYIDALAQPFIRLQKKTDQHVGYYFYDVNLKINHIIDSKNHIFLSSYFGSDKGYTRLSNSYVDAGTRTDSRNNSSLMWGNLITAFRWNHIFGPRLFSNVSSTYSRYGFDISQTYQQKRTVSGQPEENVSYGSRYFSGIRDWALKIDFDYLPSPNHYVRFGVNTIQHRFSPGVYTYRSSEEGDTTAGAQIINTYETSAYVEDDWKINRRFKLNAGIHTSAFAVEAQWYHSIQPRISSRVLLKDDLALKASFSTMVQFMHLLTNAGVGLPTDLWVPSTARVKPQQAAQFALGFAKTYKLQYEFSLEGYYKKMSNLIEYKDGASYLNVSADWQDKVALNGHGKSYGMEALLQKKTGAFSGWVGYTISKATRQFDELNFGKEFAYKYDRRHDISLALTHEWSKRMDFSMVWVYGTGNAITLPRATYQVLESPSGTYFGDRNSSRLKSYHRLDLSFSWWKDKKWGQRKWTVGVYNAYSRLNPFYVTLELNQSRTKYQLIQYSLFPIIPSVTYSFKF